MSKLKFDCPKVKGLTCDWGSHPNCGGAKVGEGGIFRAIDTITTNKRTERYRWGRRGTRRPKKPKHELRSSEDRGMFPGWILYVLQNLPLHTLQQMQSKVHSTRGKSLLESSVTTILPNWQLPLIFVWFTLKSHEHLRFHSNFFLHVQYNRCTCTRSLR